MASHSYHTWITTRVTALDEIEAAHRAVGGAGRGRRYATQQINHAYAVLLSSQFQGFCCELHAECADHLVRSIVPASLHSIVRVALTRDLKLDRGNPNPGNLGSDFGRFGLRFWDQVRAQSSRNSGRQQALETLNNWRNAIAHQDFDPVHFAAEKLLLREVRGWRNACDGLAVAFDAVMRGSCKDAHRTAAMVTTTQKRTVRSQTKPFIPGMRVSFKMGQDRVHAVIVHAYGPLGVGGRHLYRVRLEVAPGEFTQFDVAPDEVDLAPA